MASIACSQSKLSDDAQFLMIWVVNSCAWSVFYKFVHVFDKFLIFICTDIDGHLARFWHHAITYSPWKYHILKCNRMSLSLTVEIWFYLSWCRCWECGNKDVQNYLHRKTAFWGLFSPLLLFLGYICYMLPIFGVRNVIYGQFPIEWALKLCFSYTIVASRFFLHLCLPNASRLCDAVIGSPGNTVTTDAWSILK